LDVFIHSANFFCFRKSGDSKVFVILKGSFVEINYLFKNKRALNDTISILSMFFQYS
jgi:hypothetical protein